MARLHEYQGKSLLAREGIAVPRGGPARSPEDAAKLARELGGRVVIKIQAWTTNRKALSGVAFAQTPEEASDHARRMLAMTLGNFPVREVLVEEALAIKDELFVSLFIDDRKRAPGMLVSLSGGSGIEERAHSGGDSAVLRLDCDVNRGLDTTPLRRLLASSAIAKDLHEQVVDAVSKVFLVAKKNEARSVEINPLVTVADARGARVVAADCRMTIDDYAVYRHPDLGIEIARELDHPPTPLEKAAYAIEQADHRGTFFFAQMNTAAPASSKGLIGFHGAGGGGSMMSMDAIANEGFTVANFCDTSGNPSPAKVYRAARIILSQPGLVGYFGSGSGVANQEQYWSAYGLAKAFWELSIDIPVVIRLGGNAEDRAVDILHAACKGLPARVEGYRKTDPPAQIAASFATLVREAAGTAWKPRAPRRPAFVGSPSSPNFVLRAGRVWIDPAAWKQHAPKIVARASGLLKDTGGTPALAVTAEELLTKDSELIACEVECRRDGIDAVFVDLDLPGLEQPMQS
ncbi:MAG: acetate--CoA ligase family protein [Phycisphaeraceae bacterium]|nr:acetate--CoA ligase family protein [Phycisphaeraceae bacterium]